ncbi:MAG: hypothetical protein AABZ55_03425 [Bdellovibrionota bacterium]
MYPSIQIVIRKAVMILVVLTTFSFMGCGKDTVSMRFGNYVAMNKLEPASQRTQLAMATSTSAQRPSLFMIHLDRLFDSLIPNAHAAISQIKMCFKRLRFKQEGQSTSSDPSLDQDNVDLALGLVTLSTTGTDLQSVDIPSGIYKRVEFDLEDGCGVGYSLYVDNAGIYQTTDRITVKFSGSFDSKASGGVLSMSVQSVITALSGVTNGNQLKNSAEGASGSF